MDPQATFSLFMDALESGDFDEAREHAAALLAWLKRGGFAPTVHPHELAYLLTFISDHVGIRH